MRGAVPGLMLVQVRGGDVRFGVQRVGQVSYDLMVVQQEQCWATHWEM
jgi:hypothetical protein